MMRDDVFAINANCVVAAAFGWRFHNWLCNNKPGITMRSYVATHDTEFRSMFGRPFVNQQYALTRSPVSCLVLYGIAIFTPIDIMFD